MFYPKIGKYIEKYIEKFKMDKKIEELLGEIPPIKIDFDEELETGEKVNVNTTVDIKNGKPEVAVELNFKF